MDGDGSATDRPVRVVTTVYPDFARDLQKVLYSCGIESRLEIATDVPPSRQGWQPIHKVNLITKRAVRLFNAIPELHKDCREGSRSQNANGFPIEFCATWKSSLKQKIAYGHKRAKDQQLNIDCFASIQGEPILCPVEVLRIEPAGKGHTYDITVDGPNETEGVHEFYVNGYLSHNTAEINLCDADDFEVIFAKYGINGLWTEHAVAHHKRLGERLDIMGIKPVWWDSLSSVGAGRFNLNHRRMSNNSIAFITKPTREFLELVFDIMRGEGEPGFINLEAANKRRPHCEGLNPCSEILLDSYGVCNLSTLNMVRFVKISPTIGAPYVELDMPTLIEAQKLSVRIGLRMTLVTLELPHWDAIQKRDRLLGCSLTGVKDAMEQLGYTLAQEEELIAMLGNVARDEAARYAKELRVSTPLLTTCVKPEGSLSQVAGGVSSGLHMSHSPFYIRRIRINAADPLAKAVQDLGWSVHPEVGTKGDTEEERMVNARTLVVDFPVASGAQRTKFDVDVREQLNTYFAFQRAYTDHNSSITVTVRAHEWDTAREMIYEGWNDFVGVSFLSLDDHSYTLAPYEACDEKTYQALLERTKPFSQDLLSKYERAHEDFNLGKAIGLSAKEEEAVEDGSRTQSSKDEVSDSVAIPLDVATQSECMGGVCPIR